MGEGEGLCVERVKEAVHQAFNVLWKSVLFEIGIFTYLKEPGDMN